MRLICQNYRNGKKCGENLRTLYYRENFDNKTRKWKNIGLYVCLSCKTIINQEKYHFKFPSNTRMTKCDKINLYDNITDNIQKVNCKKCNKLILLHKLKS